MDKHVVVSPGRRCDRTRPSLITMADSTAKALLQTGHMGGTSDAPLPELRRKAGSASRRVGRSTVMPRSGLGCLCIVVPCRTAWSLALKVLESGGFVKTTVGLIVAATLPLIPTTEWAAASDQAGTRARYGCSGAGWRGQVTLWERGPCGRVDWNERRIGSASQRVEDSLSRRAR